MNAAVTKITEIVGNNTKYMHYNDQLFLYKRDFTPLTEEEIWFTDKTIDCLLDAVVRKLQVSRTKCIHLRGTLNRKSKYYDRLLH